MWAVSSAVGAADVHKRLRKLTEATYLTMVREHRMTEALFTLGSEGKRVLERSGAEEIVLERQPPKQLEHFIGINDFHGNLESGTLSLWLADPDAAGPDAPQLRVPAGGAAALAGMIATLRAGAANSLVLSAGDMIGAAPLVAYYFNNVSLVSVLANTLVVPVIALIIALGFGAARRNFGVGSIARGVAGTRCRRRKQIVGDGMGDKGAGAVAA